MYLYIPYDIHIFVNTRIRRDKHQQLRHALQGDVVPSECQLVVVYVFIQLYSPMTQPNNVHII